MKSSLRFLLLGIALILFGLAFQGPVESFILRYVPFYLMSPRMSYLIAALIASIFPIAGLIIAFIGFFKRD